MKAISALLREFRSGQGLKGQLLRGGFWSLIIKLLSTLMALVLAVVLARLLGAEGFGTYSFVLALVTILAIPAQMGLPNLVVRETAKAQVAERWDLMKGLWRWSSLVALAMSAALIALGALAAWLFADRLGPGQAETLWWGLLLVPLVALGNLRGAALRGLRKVVQGQLPEFVLRPLFLTIFALIAVFALGQTLGPAQAMLLHVIAAFAAFLIGAWLLLRGRPAELRAQAKLSIEGMSWLLSAVPLGVVAGANVLSSQLGIVFLGVFSDPLQVADYRIAAQASAFCIFFHSAIQTVTSPHFARMGAGNHKHAAQAAISNIARIAFFSSAALTLILLAFGEFILLAVFGEDFTSAYLPLIIMCVSYSLAAAFASSENALSMAGYERVTLAIMVGTATINLVACVALIPFFGATGAALAFGVAVVTKAVLMKLWLFRLLEIRSSILG